MNDKGFMRESSGSISDASLNQMIPSSSVGQQPTCKSWVQKKKDSFELMCAANTENTHLRGSKKKTDKYPVKQAPTQISNATDENTNTEQNTRVLVCEAKTENTYQKAKSIATNENQENQTHMEDLKEKEDKINFDFDELNTKEQTDSINSYQKEKTIATHKNQENQTHKEDVKEQEEKINFDFDKLKTKEQTDSINTYQKENNTATKENQVNQTQKDDVKEQEEKINFDFDKLNTKEQTDSVNTAKRVMIMDKKVNTIFLSRDEAIKLSTNASGTSQLRMSSRTGSNFPISYGETCITCKDDIKDIQDINTNVEQEYNSNYMKTSDEKDAGYPPTATIATVPWMQPTVGSSDPTVKKMVYNQYREMLRKYTQTSRM